MAKKCTLQTKDYILEVLDTGDWDNYGYDISENPGQLVTVYDNTKRYVGMFRIENSNIWSNSVHTKENCYLDFQTLYNMVRVVLEAEKWLEYWQDADN